MRFSVVFLLSLFCLTQGLDVGFISPAYQASTDTGAYGVDSRWPLGSTQVVAFSTPWNAYSLELWQQNLAGGATLSSQFSYTQADGEQLPQSFQWTVQTYELQLSNSPVFFFWLFNNDNSSLQQSSAYFNITIDDTSSTSAKSSPGLTSLPTSMLPSALTSSTTTSNFISSTPTSSMPISSSPGTTPTSKGLSTGAAAGIGVGASLGGILVFGIAGLAYLKRKKLRTERQQRPELSGSQPIGYSIGSPETLVSASQYTPKPVSTPSHYNPSPVELGP